MVPSDKSLVIQPDGQMMLWNEAAGTCERISGGVDEMVETFGPTYISVLVGEGDRPAFAGILSEPDMGVVAAREDRILRAWSRWRRLQDEHDRLNGAGLLEFTEWEELEEATRMAFWRWVILERQEMP